MLVPHRLTSQSAILKEESVHGCRGPITRPIVFSMIHGSYCRRRRRFTIFITTNICIFNFFMTSPPEMDVGPWSLYGCLSIIF